MFTRLRRDLPRPQSSVPQRLRHLPMRSARVDDDHDDSLPDRRKLGGVLRIPECARLHFLLRSQRLWQQSVRAGRKCRLHRRKPQRELRRRAQQLRMRFRLLPDGDEHDDYDDSLFELPG